MSSGFAVFQPSFVAIAGGKHKLLKAIMIHFLTARGMTFMQLTMTVLCGGETRNPATDHYTFLVNYWSILYGLRLANQAIGAKPSRLSTNGNRAQASPTARQPAPLA